MQPYARMRWPLLFVACASGGCAHPSMTILGDSLDPIREAFNAERGRPRILALFSPT